MFAALFIVILVWMSSPLAAQGGAGSPQKPAPGSSDPDGQPAEPAPPPVTAGWRDGFFVQTEKGDFRLQIGALVHADGRFALGDDAHAVTDTFLLRRLRPIFRARFAQRFELTLAPDFAGGNLVVQDAYIDTVFSPALRVRVGKTKSPVGLERLQSASTMLFYDRAFPTSLTPNRDVGVQVLGDVSGGVVSYAAGVFNGAVDGNSADVDTSDSKDVAGRVFVRPFNSKPRSPLRGLGVGIAGSAGRQTGAAALPSFRTASIQQPFFTYSGASADGVRVRYSPQLHYYYKAFGGLAEYVRSEVPVRKGAVREDIAHSGWQVSGSLVLTGEPASESGVRPRAAVDFTGGHFGAVQVAVRYHALRIDERAFALDFAAPGASRKAESWTVGVNWYLTPYFKYVVNFERTRFDAGLPIRHESENALVFRTHLSF